MNEKKGNIIEISSLALSLVAIIISIASFIYTVRTDRINDLEKINIINAGYGYNDILNYSATGGYEGKGTIDGMNYKIIVSNNSKQRVSLVSYEIFQEGYNSKFYYSNMIEKILDGSKQRVSFPLSLDAGESVALTFEINMLIPASVNTLLMEHLGTEATTTYEDVDKYLSEQKRDIFGNEITYTEYTKGIYVTQIENPHFPVYSVNFLTSKGNSFSAVLSRNTLN